MVYRYITVDCWRTSISRIFPIVGILVVYYIIRFRMQAIIKQQALRQIKQEHNPVKVFVAPTIRFMQWRVAVQTEMHDYVGRSYGRNIVFSDKSKRQSFPSDDLMQYVKTIKILKHFLISRQYIVGNHAN